MEQGGSISRSRSSHIQVRGLFNDAGKRYIERYRIGPALGDFASTSATRHEPKKKVSKDSVFPGSEFAAPENRWNRAQRSDGRMDGGVSIGKLREGSDGWRGLRGVQSGTGVHASVAPKEPKNETRRRLLVRSLIRSLAHSRCAAVPLYYAGRCASAYASRAEKWGRVVCTT